MANKGIYKLSPNKVLSQKQLSLREEIILNFLNVLPKRGIDGLAIYAVNPAFRHHLLHLQTVRDHREYSG